MRWPLTVVYRDGTTTELFADQYAVGVWERWAAKAGLKTDTANDPARYAVTQLRVMAWAELQRDTKTKASFEVWDTTVSTVEAGDSADVVDPTLMATSVG
jgi:hypothetical protein